MRLVPCWGKALLIDNFGFCAFGASQLATARRRTANLRLAPPSATARPPVPATIPKEVRNLAYDYDIIIIGCGPAGATLARLLPDGYKAAIIDPTEIVRNPRKVCGGLLAPDAQKFLAHCGLSLPKEVLVSPQIFAVKTIDFDTKRVCNYQRSYLNMDRLAFDRWLCSLIPDNVEKVNAKCLNVSRLSDSFAVTCAANGEETTLSCKYLVGADGANSIVRRTLFPKKKIRHYAALQRFFKANDLSPFYSCIFDKETSDCCSWSISKDDLLIYGGAFPLKKCREQFEIQLQKAKMFGFDLGEEVFSEACIVNRPKHSREIFPGRDSAFLIGEAGGFISPSSLEGISWAMRTGEALALAFATSDPEKAYKKLTKPIKRQLKRKLLKCPFMYNPLLRNTVMAMKIKSIEVK